MTGQLNISSGGLLVSGNINVKSQFSGNGVVFVDAVNGKLGIGDNIPPFQLLSKLHVYGDANITNGINTTTINASTANISTIITGNTLTLSTGTASNSNVVISANGSEIVRVTNTGRVGISTSNPTSNLHVIGTANVSANLTVGAGSASAPSITTAGDDNTGIYFPAADNVAFTVGGNEQVRISGPSTSGVYTLFNRDTANNLQQVGAFGTANLGLFATGGGVIRFFC